MNYLHEALNCCLEAYHIRWVGKARFFEYEAKAIAYQLFYDELITEQLYKLICSI